MYNFVLYCRNGIGYTVEENKNVKRSVFILHVVSLHVKISPTEI